MDSRRKILLVDEDQDLCCLIRERLDPDGCEVTVAQTKAEGLDLAKRRCFDLYLLDLRLPAGSGVELCRQIRAFDSETPLVCCSGDLPALERLKAEGGNAQAYLGWPASMELLRETIWRVMAEAANRAKDEFLALVSHELRSPLGAILMRVEMLRRRSAWRWRASRTARPRSSASTAARSIASRTSTKASSSPLALHARFHDQPQQEADEEQGRSQRILRRLMLVGLD